MQGARPARPRPAADRIMLFAVVVCLAIAVVRAAIVAAVIPYAFYVNQREIARAEAAGKPAPSVTILGRLEHSPAGAWWGRRAPYREGGDYLGVSSHHTAKRTVGAVIGVVVERERAKGAHISRVLVPRDEEALYGEAPGTILVREDGTLFRTQWAPVGRYAEFFTDVPVEQSDYDPLLTDEQAKQLQASAGLSKVTGKGFYVGRPVQGGSGTWVLLSREGTKDREFVFVPLESSPVGDAF